MPEDVAQDCAVQLLRNDIQAEAWKAIEASGEAGKAGKAGGASNIGTYARASRCVGRQVRGAQALRKKDIDSAEAQAHDRNIKSAATPQLRRIKGN